MLDSLTSEDDSTKRCLDRAFPTLKALNQLSEFVEGRSLKNSVTKYYRWRILITVQDSHGEFFQCEIPKIKSVVVPKIIKQYIIRHYGHLFWNTKLTQAPLATILGVTQSTVCKYLNTAYNQ